MSKRAERLAADICAVVATSHGITKASGGVAALHAAVAPLCDVLVEQDKQIRRTSRAIKKNARMLRRMTQPAPSPWTRPARGLVEYRPQEWRTTLTPTTSTQVPRNGHPVLDPDDDGPDSDGPWHDSKGLS